MLVRVLRALRRRLGLEMGRVLGRRLAAALPAGLPQNVRFAPMTQAQVLRYCDTPGLELSEDKVRAAFRRGETCIGALDGERLAGYHWYASEAAPHAGEIWVRIGPGTAYSYKKFVDPAYRGQRIALGLNATAGTLPGGVTHSMSFIHFDNPASWRSAARGGSRVLGYAGFWRIGRWFFAFASPGARRHGFSFERRPASAAAPSLRPARASRG